MWISKIKVEGSTCTYQNKYWHVAKLKFCYKSLTCWILRLFNVQCLYNYISYVHTKKIVKEKPNSSHHSVIIKCHWKQYNFILNLFEIEYIIIVGRNGITNKPSFIC